MGKMRTVRQPIVAKLPGLDRLDVDLFKIRLRSMQRAAPGESSVVRVKGVGDVKFQRDAGAVTARVDGKPVSLSALSSKVLKRGEVVPRAPRKGGKSN